MEEELFLRNALVISVFALLIYVFAPFFSTFVNLTQKIKIKSNCSLLLQGGSIPDVGLGQWLQSWGQPVKRASGKIVLLSTPRYSTFI